MHTYKIVAPFGTALNFPATMRIVTLSYTYTRHTHVDTYVCTANILILISIEMQTEQKAGCITSVAFRATSETITSKIDDKYNCVIPIRYLREECAISKYTYIVNMHTSICT